MFIKIDRKILDFPVWVVPLMNRKKKVTVQGCPENPFWQNQRVVAVTGSQDGHHKRNDKTGCEYFFSFSCKTHAGIQFSPHLSGAAPILHVLSWGFSCCHMTERS